MECLFRSRHTHDNNGSFPVQDDTIALHTLRTSFHNGSQLVVERISEADMAHYTALEKGEWTNALCAINDLVGDHEIHGLDLFLQRADGGEGDDAANTQMTQGSNVGLTGHFMRRKLMMYAVSGQESYVGAVVGGDPDGRCRGAPRSDGIDLGDGLETIELSQARAANDGDVYRP